MGATGGHQSEKDKHGTGSLADWHLFLHHVFKLKPSSNRIIHFYWLYFSFFLSLNDFPDRQYDGTGFTVCYICCVVYLCCIE